MAEPLVAIVLVNWNNASDTVACIDSLHAADYGRLHTILIDNGSSDGSREVLARLPGVDFIDAGENLGIARANNLGIRRALDLGADYVLLLNNDTVVDPAMIRGLVETCEADPSIGIAGPLMYYHESPRTLWFAGGRVNVWTGDTRHVGMLEEDRRQYDRVADTDYVTSCALLARREVLQEVRGVDPAYFIYFDETDFCVRARRLGWRAVIVPEARLWHKISRSMGSGSARYWFHYNRSRIIFIRKNLSAAQRFTSFCFIALVDAPRMLAHFARRRKLDCVLPYLRGFREGLAAGRG